ncbi:MAG: hypothetical protein GC136_07155 [Alphaproteobacteria bacterium]|nr:hypothetical protein [Alphaproteobacteria bacterium]
MNAIQRATSSILALGFVFAAVPAASFAQTAGIEKQDNQNTTDENQQDDILSLILPQQLGEQCAVAVVVDLGRGEYTEEQAARLIDEAGPLLGRGAAEGMGNVLRYLAQNGTTIETVCQDIVQNNTTQTDIMLSSIGPYFARAASLNEDFGNIEYRGIAIVAIENDRIVLPNGTVIEIPPVAPLPDRPPSVGSPV